jgi:hypothetical protein
MRPRIFPCPLGDTDRGRSWSVAQRERPPASPLPSGESGGSNSWMNPTTPKVGPTTSVGMSVADYLRRLFGVTAVPPPAPTAAAMTAPQSTPAMAATAAASTAATTAFAYSRILSIGAFQLSPSRLRSSQDRGSKRIASQSPAVMCAEPAAPDRWQTESCRPLLPKAVADLPSLPAAESASGRCNPPRPCSQPFCRA